MTEYFSGGTLKTVAKLKILEWYLERYVPIIDNHWDSYWYIDTHAGTGRIELRDGTVVNGSAIRTLDEYSDKFDRFYFYELDEDHFHTLHETLSDEFGYDFDIRPVDDETEDFLVAHHYDPYIKILQTDSNKGVSWLVENARSGPHWFTFVDPKGLTARKSTLDTLIDRGNMDILINYQTSGVMRNAAENAAHAHDAVNDMLGDDDWPTDGSNDDYVELYKERLAQNDEWNLLSKNMDSSKDSAYRFDMVFAAAHPVAIKIMKGVMNRDDLWDEANTDRGQSGLGDFSQPVE